MIADVPLGAFLSGGIDSSAVVAAMARAVEPSRSRPSRSASTHEAVRRAAARARGSPSSSAPSTTSSSVEPDAVELLPKLVRHYGEPFADSSAIPSFYLAELTRRHVTVALNGDGGDESFAGYTRYVANALAARLDRVPAALAAAVGGARRRLPAGRRRVERAQPRPPAGRRARRSTRRPATRATWRGSTSDAAARALHARVRGACSRGAETRSPTPWAEASGAALVDKMLEVDVDTYLPGDLLAKIDIATMAYALEARSPFLDHEFMELAASLPADAQGPRRREEVDPARGAARLAARRPPRPAQAGLRRAAVDVAPRRPARPGRATSCSTRALGRGYFRHEAVEGCSTATPPARRRQPAHLDPDDARALAPRVRRRCAPEPVPRARLRA